MDKEILDKHWQSSRRLLWKVLAAWFFFAYVIHLFVGALNEATVGGFPLGYYFAAQGSLFAFVVIIFCFARAQEKIDTAHGVDEETGGAAATVTKTPAGENQ